MSRFAFLLAVIGMLCPAVLVAPAEATSARTFVSGSGNDGNPCTRALPCLTFAGALAQTSPRGEVNCIDAGAYGTVTISFAVTISCEAGTAGVLTSVATAIFINASASDNITLRGLDINGLGTADVGVGIQLAKSVHIENCAIRGFRAGANSTAIVTSLGSTNTVFIFVTDSVLTGNSIGISLRSSGGFKVATVKNTVISGSTNDGVLSNNTAIYVNITESVISGNGGSAVKVAAAASFTNVDRTTMTNNGVALNAAASGATIRTVGNNIFSNTTAFSIASGGTIATDGQNRTGGNTNGGSGNASLTLK
jgi:hypothetical protein